jgi:branched-subunit amino acid aminotransferase/4-amino-4-deoxychorismate lyase
MRIEIDGRPASPDVLHLLSLGAYGHFTAMQVRNRATRGLDLHLARLDAANRELFDRPLNGDLVRERIRHALGADIRDASVRVYVTEASVMVHVREPGGMPGTRWRLRSVRYQRPVPHLKHLGGFAQEYHRRRAQLDGYDEVLLTTDDGTISEGGITNLCCWDGTTVHWPDAPALAGITMQLLERGLAGRGLPSRHTALRVADLPSFPAVFVTNARGIAPVEQVDDVALPVADELTTLLTDVYDSTPWTSI